MPLTFKSISSAFPHPHYPLTFPLGHPWGTIKSKSPSQLLFLLSLSQLMAPFSTQGPKLQPTEPSLTCASHLILYLVNSIPLSSSPLPGSRSSFFLSWTFIATTFNTLGVFLLSLILITPTLCQQPREMMLKMPLPTSCSPRLPASGDCDRRSLGASSV